MGVMSEVDSRSERMSTSANPFGRPLGPDWVIGHVVTESLIKLILNMVRMFSLHSSQVSRWKSHNKGFRHKTSSRMANLVGGALVKFAR